MIASTLVAAALASTNPAQAAAPAPAAPAKAHHAGMAGHEHMKSATGMAEGKMDCCKDGCECCAKTEAAKAGDAPHAH